MNIIGVEKCNNIICFIIDIAPNYIFYIDTKRNINKRITWRSVRSFTCHSHYSLYREILEKGGPIPSNFKKLVEDIFKYFPTTLESTNWLSRKWIFKVRKEKETTKD